MSNVKLPKGMFTVGVIHNLIRSMTMFSIAIFASLLTLILGGITLPPEPVDLLHIGFLALVAVFRLKNLFDTMKSVSAEAGDSKKLRASGILKFTLILLADIAIAGAVSFLFSGLYARLTAVAVLLLWGLAAVITQLVMGRLLNKYADNPRMAEFISKLGDDEEK